MKLTDVLLLGATLLFLVIGIDQSIVLGFTHAYWAFMLALAAIFFFNYRRSRRSNDQDHGSSKPAKKHKGK
jgi:hypothetical protein